MASVSKSPNLALNSNQLRVVITLWLVYALYYVGRVNLSPALASLAESLNVTRAEVGILGTAMFWAYAIGQLINGELGNHISPRKIIAVGFGTIAIVNLLFSAQTTLAPMLVLWAINGFAQSTGWGPILRILSEHLTVTQRTRVSMPFSLSYQFGTAFTWFLATLLVLSMGWQAALFVPGCIMVVALVLWLWFGADAPKSTVEPQPFKWSDLWKDMAGAWRIMLVTGIIGIVYTSVSLWLPTYFADTGLFDSGFISVISSIMPLIGAAGMLVAAWMIRRTNDPLSVLRTFVFGIMVAAGLAALTTGAVQVLFIAFVVLAMGSTSSMLTTTIPLMLASSGRASSTAGTINAINYFGGGLAGVLVGSLVESRVWSNVFGLWTLCAGVALLLMWGVKRRE
jgi:sugar phosphate permease